MTNSLNTLPPDVSRHRMMNTAEFAAFIGLSVPHARRLVKAGKLPQPVRLSERKLGWPLGEVLDWLATRTAA